ncbi:methionyl-tRNA formyltransferase [Candidatus Termititenax persephonae]|uniref:Methionyl-tRNA formyltransferase n=1 Tax=Candidatus Termititenax persephonae TaxID=2218525 RepID=A0A388TGY1_9BACT|nr:methionyl-tRNA formyltransferase [Candidatus Termititenax persephonae]
MQKVLNITILTDQGSWMNKYNILLTEMLRKNGHCVKVIHSEKELPSGDIAFFLSYFGIISIDYLRRHKNNIVVHASKLPYGKGWSPMTWQILEGKNEIPITLFEAVEKMDSGDIYLEDIVKLDGSELLAEWQVKLGKKVCAMCLEYVKQYQAKTIIPRQQNGQSTYYARRKPEDSELDTSKTLDEQFNLLRTVDNDKYPAFFYKNGHTYLLKIFTPPPPPIKK